jgi:chromosome partitioning protein
MAIRISIANQKGSCGKTSTAINLADALRRMGYKVLFVDCDAQANATKLLQMQPPFVFARRDAVRYGPI